MDKFTLPVPEPVAHRSNILRSIWIPLLNVLNYLFLLRRLSSQAEQPISEHVDTLRLFYQRVFDDLALLQRSLASRLEKRQLGALDRLFALRVLLQLLEELLKRRSLRNLDCEHVLDCEVEEVVVV